MTVRPALPLAVIALGAGVLLAAETTLLRTAGALLMVGGLALAVFAVATPEFTRGDSADAGAGEPSASDSVDPETVQ